MPTPTTVTASLARGSSRMPATVIVYHGVGDCPPAADPYHLLLPTGAFRWQMAFLARHRRVVPLASLVDEPDMREEAATRGDPRPRVAITFDDGYRTFLTTALPILEARGFPAAIFVPAAWIGDHNGWDAPRPGAHELPLMSRDELRECQRRGVEVGSHGDAHRHLTALSDAEAEQDLVASRQRLATVLGQPPRFLAYPWGEHSAPVRGAACRAGYTAAFTINQLGHGPYARERVAIRRSDGPSIFRVKTSGRYLRLRMALGPRLVLRLAEPLLRAYREGR